MPNVLEKLGTFAGVAGLLTCLLTGLMRLSGSFYLGDVALVTLFQAGVALVVVACYCKLEAASQRSQAAQSG